MSITITVDTIEELLEVCSEIAGCDAGEDYGFPYDPDCDTKGDEFIMSSINDINSDQRKAFCDCLKACVTLERFPLIRQSEWTGMTLEDKLHLHTKRLHGYFERGYKYLMNAESGITVGQFKGIGRTALENEEMTLLFEEEYGDEYTLAIQHVRVERFLDTVIACIKASGLCE